MELKLRSPGNFPLEVDVGALSARIASLKGHPRGRIRVVGVVVVGIAVVVDIGEVRHGVG